MFCVLYMFCSEPDDPHRILIRTNFNGSGLGARKKALVSIKLQRKANSLHLRFIAAYINGFHFVMFIYCTQSIAPTFYIFHFSFPFYVISLQSFTAEFILRNAEQDLKIFMVLPRSPKNSTHTQLSNEINCNMNNFMNANRTKTISLLRRTSVDIISGPKTYPEILHSKSS